MKKTDKKAVTEKAEGTSEVVKKVVKRMKKEKRYTIEESLGMVKKAVKTEEKMAKVKKMLNAVIAVIDAE